MLLLYRPGEAHTTNLFWSEDWSSLLLFYIDLMEPLRRAPIGFDTRDHVLDATVSADRSSWSWKDEDELEWRIETGRLAPDEVAGAREEGLRAIERLITSGLYEDWENWRPDERWRRPEIPPRWAQTHWPALE